MLRASVLQVDWLSASPERFVRDSTCHWTGIPELCVFTYMEAAMLKYAIIFAIISLIAGALGFGGIAAGSAGIAKVLFGLFLVIAIIFVVLAALGVGAAKKMID